jgi:hypothetical protein
MRGILVGNILRFHNVVTEFTAKSSRVSKLNQLVGADHEKDYSDCAG